MAHKLIRRFCKYDINNHALHEIIDLELGVPLRNQLSPIDQDNKLRFDRVIFPSTTA